MSHFLQGVIGDYGVYWLFSSLCLVSLLFDIFIVKETKGKTLQEICEMFGAPTIEGNCEDDDDSDCRDYRTQYKSI